MVAYGDGGLSVFSAGETLEELCHGKLGNSVRHFAACPASTTPSGYNCFFAASHAGGVGITVGHVDIETAGHPGSRTRASVTPKGTFKLPGSAAASCVLVDAPSMRLVYGTGSGVVGVRDLQNDTVTEINLANGNKNSDGKEFFTHEAQGPHCHSVSCWSFAPNIVIASA